MISYQTGKFQIFTFIPRRLSSWAKQNKSFVEGAGFWGKGRNVMDARPHEGRKEEEISCPFACSLYSFYN